MTRTSLARKQATRAEMALMMYNDRCSPSLEAVLTLELASGFEEQGGAAGEGAPRKPEAFPRGTETMVATEGSLGGEVAACAGCGAVDPAPSSVLCWL